MLLAICIGLNDRIGPKRAKNAYAYKKLLEKSGIIAFGTDFPVEDISPIMTFYSAVVRKDINPDILKKVFKLKMQFQDV